MSNPSRRVSVVELAGEDRRSVENLLGQPLEDEQEVYVLAFQPGVVPDESARQQALANMRTTFAKAEQHAEGQGADDSEIDEAVDEAMDHVRYGKA
jgi:hypothetical protein